MIWVVLFHWNLFWHGEGPFPYMFLCLNQGIGAYFKSLFLAGDQGVDIFFVLSGYLIAHVLLKECDKYDGKIDVIGFYRGRFLRIYPVMLVYVLFLHCLPET